MTHIEAIHTVLSNEKHTFKAHNLKDTLPNLIVIGAPKCATTSLHAYLSTHPMIFMSQQKELHFFLKGASWGSWNYGVEWYRSQFAEGATKEIRGESSPGYSLDQFCESAAEGIAYLLPDVKLIYMLRNPIERIRSNYTEELYGGRIPSNISLNTVLSTDSNDNGLLGHYRREFVNTSLYHLQLLRYLKYFSLDQIMILTAESLRKTPIDSLNLVWRFLGIREDFTPPNIEEKLNQRSKKRLRVANPTQFFLKLPNYKRWSNHIPNSVKNLYRKLISRNIDHTKLIEIDPYNVEKLQVLFRSDIENLQNTTGLNFDDWGV